MIYFSVKCFFGHDVCHDYWSRKSRWALLLLPPNCLPSDTRDDICLSYKDDYFPTYPSHIYFSSSVSFSSQFIIEHSILFDVCGFHFSSFLFYIDHCFSYPWFSWDILFLPITLFRISNSVSFTFSQLLLCYCQLINLSEFLLNHFI